MSGMHSPEHESPTSTSSGFETTSNSSANTPYLPPCRVCGIKASGFHYGVNTCEACKGFFRRCLLRKSPYKCEGTSICEVSATNRACPKCRYDRCIAVGMCKAAIKTGRYTHAKKTKDTQEVKQLKSLQTPSTAVADPGKSSDFNIPFIDVSGKCSKDDLSPFTFQQSYTSTAEYQDDIQRFLDAIAAEIKDRGVTNFLNPDPDGVQSQVEKFMEDRMVQVQLFGRLKPLSRDEYLAFYRTTGIDIDHRKRCLEKYTFVVETHIKKLIAMAKRMPGFSQLAVSDQITLIKGARFEHGMLITHKRYDVERGCFVTPNAGVRTKDDMQRVLSSDPEYVDGVYRLAQKLQELKLTPVEIITIFGLVLFSRDRDPGLQSPDDVEQWQRKYIDAVEHSFRVNHSKEKNLLGKLFSCLVQLRELGEQNAKIIANVRLDWKDEIKFPELFIEYVD